MVHNTRMKELIVLQIKEQMKIQGINKSQLSKSANITRPTLDRVLDKNNMNINISTIIKIGNILGRKISIKLVDDI